MTKEKSLKQSIEILEPLSSYILLESIPENLIKGNIYLRKVRQLFSENSYMSEEFKSGLFEWYKSNLKNTLYSIRYKDIQM